MSGQPAWAAVISYGYVAVEVAAALFILARWRSLAPPSRLVGYWLLVAASFALIEQVARIVFRNSQYVAQLWYPLSGALALTAVLAAGARRGTVQVVVACYLIVQVVLFFTVEVYGEYAKATGKQGNGHSTLKFDGDRVTTRRIDLHIDLETRIFD